MPASPKARRANRVRTWKTGKYAKTVTIFEVAEARLRQIHPEAPQILKAYTDLVMDGNVEGRKKLVAEGMAAQDIVLRRSINAVLKHGELVEEPIMDSEDVQIGIRYKANPLMDTVIRLSENLGYTAEQQEMTPQSQKEGAKNVAAEMAAQREARLYAALQRTHERRNARDPRAIDTTVVE